MDARSDEEKPKDSKDFFISYTGADRRWAEWIAWILEDHGYNVILQAWDFHAGDNFIRNIHEALETCERTITLLSASYLQSGYCRDEWTTAFNARGLLLVRIEDLAPPGLLSTLAYFDLFGVEEEEAQARLLNAIKQDRAKPAAMPLFPGAVDSRMVGGKPRFPGTLPTSWNVPQRNIHFTGRENVLERLRDHLNTGATTALTQPQVVHGLGGVGKSQLAIEYAYRFSADYDVAWWLEAETPESLVTDYQELARVLGLAEKEEVERSVIIVAVRRWLEGNAGWLLIFDNAENSQDLEPVLPRGGGGHVIITSRNPSWGVTAQTLDLNLWPRADSLEFLNTRVNERDDVSASRIADALGDLPLALEQAAAYCEQTGTTLKSYAELLDWGYASELWREPRDFKRTVDAVWQVSFKKVQAEEPAAAQLLNLFAYFAPDRIPLDIMCSVAKHMPPRFREIFRNVIALNRAVGVLKRFSLVRREGDDVSVHRLVQAITRERLKKTDRRNCVKAATHALNSALPNFPHSAFDAGVAGMYDRLTAHVLVAAGHAEDLGTATEQSARLFNQIGLYREMRADYAGAKAAYEKARALFEETLGSEHPQVATATSNLGRVLADQGETADAKAAFESALAIDEKAFGPDHPTIATDVNNLGSVLQDRGDLSAAKAAYERALTIDEKHFGRDHPEAAVDLLNLGGVIKAQGDLARAKKAFERALAIDEKHFGPDHPNVARDFDKLGRVLQEQGDLESAKAVFERALSINETCFGSDHPTVARDVNNLGLVYRTQADLAAARSSFERALTIYLKFFDENHANVRSARDNLAAVNEALSSGSQDS
ncbi:MAG: tetratricopeptide repeat protein [Hyphomicrobiales bacterium]|nr:tetratricopeptide repeat protein [Hyphomicrobiales bacterium]